MSKHSSSIDLYTFALSPYGMKVYWALVFKQVDFELHYVSPRGQKEIAFTNQRVVPVLKVGEEWRLDSGPLCMWLEELVPERPFAGGTQAERQAVLDADDWVSNNVIALQFRRAIDPETAAAAWRNGRKLARIMRQTSGGIPWIAQFFWSRLLRQADFIKRAAAMTDQSKSVAELEQELIAAFDTRLAKTGFIAGTASPSFADLAVFAQVASSTDLEMEGGLKASSSMPIKAWFERMLEALPKDPHPVLIRGRAPITQTYGG